MYATVTKQCNKPTSEYTTSTSNDAFIGDTLYAFRVSRLTRTMQVFIAFFFLSQTSWNMVNLNSSLQGFDDNVRVHLPCPWLFSVTVLTMQSHGHSVYCALDLMKNLFGLIKNKLGHKCNDYDIIMNNHDYPCPVRLSSYPQFARHLTMLYWVIPYMHSGIQGSERRIQMRNHEQGFFFTNWTETNTREINW